MFLSFRKLGAGLLLAPGAWVIVFGRADSNINMFMRNKLKNFNFTTLQFAIVDKIRIQ